MTYLAGVQLPDNLYWSDEFQWSAAAQTRAYSLTGALLLEEAPRQAGRPITLEGMWVERTTVEAVQALADAPGSDRLLTLPDGRQFSVRFRHDGGPAVDARPLHPVATPAPDTLYSLTLRLLEV